MALVSLLEFSHSSYVRPSCCFGSDPLPIRLRQFTASLLTCCRKTTPLFSIGEAPRLVTRCFFAALIRHRVEPKRDRTRGKVKDEIYKDGPTHSPNDGDQETGGSQKSTADHAIKLRTKI